MIGPADVAARRRTRHAPVVVEHPLLTVIEGSAPADPTAMHGALEILVKWAVRAHTGCSDPTVEAADGAEVAAVGVQEQA